jgi:hypothetical protein
MLNSDQYSGLELADVDALIADLEVKLQDVHELPAAMMITAGGCGTTEDTVRNTCNITQFGCF